MAFVALAAPSLVPYSAFPEYAARYNHRQVIEGIEGRWRPENTTRSYFDFTDHSFSIVNLDVEPVTTFRYTVERTDDLCMVIRLTGVAITQRGEVLHDEPVRGDDQNATVCVDTQTDEMLLDLRRDGRGERIGLVRVN